MNEEERELEGKKTEVAEAEGNQADDNSEHQPKTEGRPTLLRNIQIVLAGLGLFAALTYFLGRLYIESYYSAFGISVQALSFKPEDYMFSSFDLIIMCLLISLVIYLYQLYSRSDIDFWQTILSQSNKLDVVADIVFIIFILSMAGLSLANIFAGVGRGSSIPGMLGFMAGFGIGVAVIFFIWFSKFIVRAKKGLHYIQIVYLVLVLSAALPYTAGKLADVRVTYDLDRLPKAVLVCEEDLPMQLQESPQTPGESMTVRIVTFNNEMVYLFKDEDFASESSSGMPKVYAIRMDDIDYIIYSVEQ